MYVELRSLVMNINLIHGSARYSIVIAIGLDLKNGLFLYTFWWERERAMVLFGGTESGREREKEKDRVG